MSDFETREANRLRQRDWRAANPERWKEIHKASATKRRAKRNKAKAKKRAENRERVRDESFRDKVDRLTKQCARLESIAMACAAMCVGHDKPGVNSFLIVEHGKAAQRLLGVLPKETPTYTINRDVQHGLWSNTLEAWYIGQKQLEEAMKP